MLGIEAAQLSLRRPGLSGQSPGGGVRAPKRSSREGQTAQQVIPVAVGGEQAGDRKPCLRQHVGKRTQLLGYTGESITKPSSPSRTAVHVVCQTSLTNTITSDSRATARIRTRARARG